jgi:hypothetical protein
MSVLLIGSSFATRDSHSPAAFAKAAKQTDARSRTWPIISSATSLVRFTISARSSFSGSQARRRWLAVEHRAALFAAIRHGAGMGQGRSTTGHRDHS